MKAWQNRRISESDLPLGSKSARELPVSLRKTQSTPKRVLTRSTLSTAERKSRQGVLEDLLESEELEDGQVDGRVQAETALVRAEDRAELDTVAAVDVDLTGVVLSSTASASVGRLSRRNARLPGHAELNDTLRDGHDLECAL